MTAPEFPGLDEVGTPVYDQLLADTRCTMSEAEAQAMVTEGFESWGLDEIAPLPIESLIKDLKSKVGEGMAWVIESEAGHAVLADRLMKNLGEGDDDAEAGPDDDAGLADGPEGPSLVGGDGGDDSAPAGES